MSDPKTESRAEPEPGAKPTDAEKLTVFGEPLWKDALKSMGCGLMMLLMTGIVGGILGIAIMAPWGRASFECSIYCVIRQYIDAFF
ncbi:MAG: hypothetical protein ACI8W7_002000 [Gammaproteobacteria bacterium]|jgi:hypothetical protein